jgi:hypothetical protein
MRLSPGLIGLSPNYGMPIGPLSVRARALADLQFAAGGFGLGGSTYGALTDVPGYTFARASAGRSLDGTLSFASGIPRIVPGLGILSEMARTTLAPRSRRLDDAAIWTASNMTTSAVAGVDGVAGSATRLVATANNATLLAPSVTLASAARRVAPFIRRVAGTGNIDVTIDGGSTWTTLVGVTGAFTRLGAGQTVANPQIGVRLASSGDEIDIDFMGGETGEMDTSPIESADTVLTRAADDAVITGLVIPSSGSMIVEATPGANGQSGGGLNPVAACVADSASASNAVTLGRNPSTATSENLVRSSAATVALMAGGTWSNNTRRTVAASWATDDFAFAFPGSALQTDTAGAAPTGMTRIHIGQGRVTTAGQFNGYVGRIILPAQRLTNAQLQGWAA